METISEQLELLIKPAERRLKMIWCGQFISLGIYIFIAFKVAARTEGTKPENILITTAIFGLLGFLLIVCSFFIKHFLFSPKAVLKLLNGNFPVKFSNRPDPFLIEQKDISDLSEEEQLLLKFANKSFPFVTICWGFLQSVAIIGMVLSILNQNPFNIIPFATVAAILYIFQYPDLKKLFEAALLERSFRHN